MDFLPPSTPDAAVVLEQANAEAVRLMMPQVTVVHLLLSLAKLYTANHSVLQRLRRTKPQRNGLVYLSGLSPRKLEATLERQQLSANPEPQGVVSWSHSAETALQFAMHECNWSDERLVMLEHIAIGALRTPEGSVVAETLDISNISERVLGLRTEIFAGPMQSARRQRSRYTRSARLAVSFAQQEARDHHHDSVDTGHLLIGLASERDGLASRVLRNLGVDAERLRGRLLQMQPAQSREQEVIGLSGTYKRVLDRAANERHVRKHARLGTGHLLYHIALLDEDDVAVRVLRRCEIRRRDLVATLADYIELQLALVDGVDGAVLTGSPVRFTLTFEAQRNFEVALEESQRLDHRVLDTAHLLMGLMMDESSLTAHMLRVCGLDRRRVRGILELSNAYDYRFPLNPRRLADDLQQAMTLAIDEACIACEYAVVNPLHLLAAVLKQKNSMALSVLHQLDIDMQHLRTLVSTHLDRIRT